MIDIYHSNDISVVVDNNILVDLYELNSLYLLFELFHTVTIPTVIYEDEMFADIKLELNRFIFQQGQIHTEIGLETYAFLVNQKDYQRLSYYDRHAIAIAKETDFYCNSNDKLVRKACEKLKVKFTGILGILGRAYIKGKIDVVTLYELLKKLASDDTSCFIDLKTLEAFKIEIESEKNKPESS